MDQFGYKSTVPDIMPHSNDAYRFIARRLSDQSIRYWNPDDMPLELFEEEIGKISDLIDSRAANGNHAYVMICSYVRKSL